MKILQTLRNIEFGADPYQLFPTPKAVERTARVYLFARDMMQAAALVAVRRPQSEGCSDALMHARDSYIFASGDLWQALRSGGHYHQLFEVDEHFVYLSDSHGPNRPFIIAVDSLGKRPCPACYGTGVYQCWFPDPGTYSPCVCCGQSGSVSHPLPGCTRKELVAHVD